MRRTTIALLPLLLFAACKKPQPSPDFAEAQSAHSSITASLGDDAYADPEMDRVLGLLAKVPADSPDAAAAAELRGTIAKERARIAEEERVRKADLDVLHQPADAPPPEPTPEAPPPEPAPPAEDPTNASTQPQVGMPVDVFLKSFSACFGEGEVIEVSNLGKKARTFGLGTDADCAKKHAAFVGKLVLVVDGKVLTFVARDSVKSELRDPADAGARAPVAAPAPAPDAGS